ncbi:hypothetical protein N7509_010276 [Penicillium cosmopolitanum]|uniref:Major facilitator superfamily (MFS) profile domain-containing protein n=1 Tax=Penicillium cosmopolitanum TaxID=1131564 RepID=A0A9W9VR72_9EURO|nr:uncharacterized protein N7509_010276 [Penicillium cosmopolitanum]KAJ5387735.1 hypothetical protein N7509_010276 [Penicillium cosmopolitanum]
MGLKPFLGLRGNALLHATLMLVVCPTFTCYGYNMSVAGGLLTLTAFNNQFPSIDTLHTTGEVQQKNSQIQGVVMSLFTVGGIFGALSCVFFGDRWGRRKVIFISNVITIIGAILMATSFSLAQFVVGRLVLGVGIGGYVATVPVWQSEISPAHMRGSNVVIDGIFVGSGVALALWVDLGFFFVKESSVSWRFPLAFQIIFSIIAIIFITMLPESPRWLIKKGRVEEGRQVLAALLDVEEHSDIVNDGVYDIESSLSHCGTGSWKDMFTNGEQRLFHRTYLAATGQMFQQMCGINVITFYATTIFEQYLGMSPVNARIIAAAMPLTQPFGGWLAYYTIDRLGRRPLLIWSAVALAVCMAGLAGCTSPSAANNTAALAMAVVFLYCFQFIATIGYAGLTFLYAAEIAPLQIRAAVNAISTATVWSFNFLLAVITPVGFATIGYHFYIIFAIINALMAPSTKDRSLEEIDEIFAQSKNIFDPPRVARAMQRKMQTVHIGDVHPESGDIVEIKKDALQMDVKA